MSKPNPESAKIAIQIDDPPVSRRIRRKKTPFFLSPLFIVTLLLLGAGGGVFVLWQQQQTAGIYTLGTIPKQTTIDEGEPFEFAIPFATDSVDYSRVNLALTKGEPGATIDPATGAFRWTPSEEQGPGEYLFEIHAQARDGSSDSRRQFILKVAETNSPVSIPFIENQAGIEGETFRYLVEYEDADIPRQRYRFRLLGDVPEGASIDAETGQFEFAPGSVELNRPYPIEVEITEEDFPESKASRSFQVTFEAYDPVARFRKMLAGVNVETRDSDDVPARDFKVPGRTVLASIPEYVDELGHERLEVFAYGSQTTADDELQFIAADLSKFFGKSDVFQQPTRIYRDDRLFVIATGVSPQLQAKLSLALGTPIAAAGLVGEPTVASGNPPSSLPDLGTKIDPRKQIDAAGFTPPQLQQLADMLTDETLFDKKSHATLRKLFAERFASRFESEIRTASEADEEFAAWLADQTEFREKLLTAINPDRDQVPAVLNLAREIWKRSPEKFAQYPDLAIAIAVVWDDERRGVYDYRNHQVCTHTTLPDDLATAFDIFDYYVAAEKGMEGRTKLVPWEFMLHLVNHRTPIKEQQWAFQNYVAKRVMFGECYSEVPYDYLMLQTGSERCKLQGEEYSLPNIRTLGGVCAMQADFAARVGKSLGVPAEYVAGEAASGDRHAWVMWVELKNLTKTGINFSLESHGRYNIDKYYVGTLPDPQTGGSITDRQLELRLHTVGLDPRAKRQADWVMLAYPALVEKNRLDLDGKIAYLQNTIALSPGNEAAWSELAMLAGSGNLTRKHERVMRQTLDKLFATFANFPDFTWTVFDNLIQFETEPAQQIKLYERLLQLYLQAGRPDLASEARLMLTGYLIDAERQLQAVEGLAATIMAFPDDGRYTPRLLDRLEVLCVDNPVYQKKLIDFYKLFLPKVPRTRGDRTSKYCVSMYERGIDRFTRAGETQLAASYTAELNKLKAKMTP